MPHYESEPKIDTTKATGDWRDQLYQDGYYVLKGVLSPEKAQSYVDRQFQWLESFPYGFKADDSSTWGKEHLPDHIKYVVRRSVLRKTDKTQGRNVLRLSCPARKGNLGR